MLLILTTLRYINYTSVLEVHKAEVIRMAGNFRGVVIFVIFVVDLAVMKFSHPQKLMPTVICESMMMGMATNIMAARPVLASNSNRCHPADGVFDTNILLSHAICSSLCRYGLVTKKITSACIDCIIACAAVPCPWTGCCHEI